MKREHWKTRFGFMWSAIGSAVGLGSIWRFPYVVGQHGGAAFIILFIVFLLAIGLPVLMTEVLIGRKAQADPAGAFNTLGRGPVFRAQGILTIITGFIVSSFYSVISGWTLGYLIESITGRILHFTTLEASQTFFQSVVTSGSWTVGCHFGFLFLASFILYFGVQKGIESANKIFMPLLFVILIVLVIKGISLQGSEKGLQFILTPDWSKITPTAMIMALGQALFGLSIGQGTMVTYGSYLSERENIPNTCFPITVAVTIVSLLAGIAIFTVVFAVGASAESGPNLMFQTLPLVFSQITGGYFVALAFFFLIFLAGLTSQISAMEPLIAYLIKEQQWSRHGAVALCAVGAFLLGIPSALSYGLLSHMTFWGNNFFDMISGLCINILIPIGALFALILAGWRWGIKEALTNLRLGTGPFYRKTPLIQGYLYIAIKYLCPFTILFILLNLIGLV